VRLGARIFGVLAAILILYLVVGLILPGSWQASAEIDLPAPPSVVFPYLDHIDQWTRWTPMPSSGAESFGPDSGEGAGLQWKDPQYGTGRMEILTTQGDTLMEYRVAIEDGTLEISGTLHVQGLGSGSHLVWEEEGDFGWNPLMGYAARGMGRSQSAAMRASLEKLRDLVAQGAAHPTKST